MQAFFMPFVTPALLALLLAGSLLVVISDWSMGIEALFKEYVATAIVMTQLVIVEVALVKLIAGLLVVTIMGLTAWQLNFGRPGTPGAAPWQYRFETPTALPFRLMAVIMVVVSALYIAGQPNLVLPGLVRLPAINSPHLPLMAPGLLHLVLTEEP